MTQSPQSDGPGPRRSWLDHVMRRPPREPGEPEPVAHSPGRRPWQATSSPHSTRRARWLRIREPVPAPLRLALSVVPFALFFAWWLWATAGAPEERRISPTILPSPGEVVAYLPSVWYDSALMRNILLSLARVLAGFFVAALVALPLGIAMGAFGRIGATFGLFAAILSYIPIPAIVPLTMAWWRTGEEQKIGFLALGTFVFLLPLVVRTINAVDHKYLLSAYAQGATAWQVVSRVLVPIALPDICNGLRLCLGIGWAYIVLAEVIKSGEGIGGVGNLIMVFQRRGHMDGVYLTVAAIMMVGALLDRTCLWVIRWLFPYRAGVEHG